MKLRGLAWFIFFFGILFTRLGFLEDIVYNIDEAEYAVAADALDQGWLPGVDLLGTTKPPGIAVLYNLLFHTFGRSMAVIHVGHLVIVLLSGLVLIELGIALWGLAAAVPAAVLYWMLLSTWNLPQEIMALNVESPGVLFILPALLLAWKRPRMIWALLVCGVCAGAAALFRQSFAAFLLPIAAAVWMSGAQQLRRLSIVGVGFLTPWLPVLAVYASRGALGWAWDSWVRYPLAYSGDTGPVGFLVALYMNTSEFLPYALAPLALGIGGAIVLWRQRESAAARFLGFLFIASVLALFSGSRFFGHYWLQLYPALTLFGVPAWLLLVRGSKRLRWILTGAVGLGGLMAALHFPTWRSWDSGAPPTGISFWTLGAATQSELKVGAFGREQTAPGETIAVWGYCPQIYYHANRLPGARDFLCHYVTGYSPGSFDPVTQRAVRPWGHPRAQQMFIEDLERRRPKYVFDLVQVDDYVFPFIQYSLRFYPELADYLRQNYLPEGQIDKVLVYRRRTAADTWWPAEDDVK